MEKQRKATLLALTAVIFWATAATAFKLSLRYLDPFLLLFCAAFISWLVFLVFSLIRKKGHELLKTSKEGILHSAFLGFLNPFLYYAVLLQAYKIIPAQEAVILNYTWPLVLVFLSVPLLKQKIGLLSFTALFISFFGTVVVFTQGDILGFRFTHPVGGMMALGSAFIWALFWIQNVKDSREETNKLFWNFFFGTIYASILVLFTCGFKIPGLPAFIGLTYIGLFEMGITFILWLMALQLSTTTAKVSNLIFLSPIISLVLIHFILGEYIQFSSIIGLVIILFGIWLQRRDSSSKRHTVD